MTLEDIVAVCGKLGLTIQNHDPSEVLSYRNKYKHETTGLFIVDEWSTGGRSGGNCWNNDEPESYSTNNTEPSETQFDKLIEVLRPSITFLEYRKCRTACLAHGTRSEDEYYGNRSDYAFVFCKLETLHEYGCNLRWW